MADKAAQQTADIGQPEEGWIVTMRKALAMSGSQLARRVGVTRAAIYQAERSERDGAITLKQLEKIAQGLGGRLVYAIVPEDMIRSMPSGLAKIVQNCNNHPARVFFVHFSKFYAITIPIGMNMQKIDDNEALGALIRKERRSRKLTQEELAALAGVGVRFVRELEHGKETCRIGLALRVMHTLGLRALCCGCPRPKMLWQRVRGTLTHIIMPSISY